MKPGNSQKVLFDIISLFITLVPISISYYLTVKYIINYYDQVILLIFSPLILITSLILQLFIMRKSLPSLKPGIYTVGANKLFLSWLINLSLSRVIKIALVKDLVHSSMVLKWIYWRALGGKIDFGITSALDISITDFQLITIQKNCTIAAYAHISAHTFLGDKLLLGKVQIKENSFIGMNSMIGPRTTIGSNCYIGLHNKLFRNTLKDNQRLEDFQWVHGKDRA